MSMSRERAQGVLRPRVRGGGVVVAWWGVRTVVALVLAVAAVGVGLMVPGMASAATMDTKASVYDAPHLYGLDCSVWTVKRSVRWSLPNDIPQGVLVRIVFQNTDDTRVKGSYPVGDQYVDSLPRFSAISQPGNNWKAWFIDGNNVRLSRTDAVFGYREKN